MDHVHADLGVLDLAELTLDRLDRALNIALDDQVDVAAVAGVHALEQMLEADAARRARGQLLAAQPLGALLGAVAGLPLALDHAAELACRRRTVEPEDLDRVARARVVQLLALVVVQSP